MGGELLGQALVGRVILGDDQQAAGVLVEPVHDAGALYAADARQAIAAMGDEGIDQGARLVAGAGVNHQPCGLVDHDQVLVFIDHGEGNGFGPGFGLPGWRNHRFHALARLQLVADFGCGNTLDRDLAFRDKPLKAGAADLGKGQRQETVQPVRASTVAVRVWEACDVMDDQNSNVVRPRQSTGFWYLPCISWGRLSCCYS